MKLTGVGHQRREARLVETQTGQQHPGRDFAGAHIRVLRASAVGRYSPRLRSRRRSSASSGANRVRATELRGCMTMSHPEGISERSRRRISRMRRRIRLRTTAPPNAFFTLMPKRLCSFPLARKKTTNCWLERLWPPRYTASNSARRARRTARGNLRGGPAKRLDGREAIAPLPAARRKDFASAFRLHARAEAVRLVATPNFGLEGAFRQR